MAGKNPEDGNKETSDVHNALEEGHQRHRRLTIQIIEEMRSSGDLSEDSYRKFMETTEPQ